MPLTVRLDPALERALELYCTTQGVSKSLVVQESLASYLVSAELPAGQPGVAGDPKEQARAPSANWQAFERAGLIGCVAGDGVAAVNGADKAAVRAKATSRRKP